MNKANIPHHERTILVLGASTNPARYSFLAVRMLKEAGFQVIAFGRKKGEVAGIPLQSSWPEAGSVETVTIYLNAVNQEDHVQDVLNLQPGRIIFNPGAFNPKLAEMAEKKGIEVVNACSLVMISTGTF